MLARRFFMLFSLFFVLGLSLPADALAVFRLDVSPRRGGQNIRFSAEGGFASGGERTEQGGLLRNEEVTLTVTTDRAAQYRILETVFQPLTNELGNTIPAGAFIQFSPSTPLGTLRTQLETPVSMGQKHIYTSNTAGDTDDFVLVFNVRVPENQAGGVYRTQLTFSAELINAQGGVAPSTTTLEVRVELTPRFRLALQNAKGTKVIDLGRITQEKRRATDTLTMEIESNIGSRYRIFHQLTDLPFSAAGEALEENALTLVTAGASSGGSLSGQGSPQPVPQSATLLYQSNEWGGGDRFQLQFFLTPSATQKAGVYTGTLSFRAESSSPFVNNEVINIPIKIEIESIFSLETQLASAGGLNFGTFRSGQEKQEQKVVLKVLSNLGEPYQISQVVPRKMTNDQGAAIPKEHFQFFGQSVKTGVLSAASPRAVEEGETLVFTSDKNGTPEEFVLNYILTVPRDAKAGAYRSELKYSITTL